MSKINLLGSFTLTLSILSVTFVVPQNVTANETVNNITHLQENLETTEKNQNWQEKIDDNAQIKVEIAINQDNEAVDTEKLQEKLEPEPDENGIYNKPEIAELKEESSIELIIAAEENKTNQAKQQILENGGEILSQNIDIAKINALVPLGQVPQVLSDESILAANENRVLPLPESTELGFGNASYNINNFELLPSTPLKNPYMPIGDMGAENYQQEIIDMNNKIKIGVVDTGITPNHPAFIHKNENIIKKYDNLMNTTASDPAVIALRTKYDATSGQFSYAQNTYTVNPAIYYGATVSERRFSAYGEDINNNNVKNENILVLYNPNTKELFYDKNQNKDYRDESPIKNNELGNFDTQNVNQYLLKVFPNPAKENPGVEDNLAQFVFDQVGHGTHVSSIIAGNNLASSNVNGVVPNAELYSYQVCSVNGCPTEAITRAVEKLATEDNVEVINISIGYLNSNNDGLSANEILYDRISEQENVLIVSSAGNDGPGINTVSNPSSAKRIISVGAYVSRETLQSNYGIDNRSQIFQFSSRGMSEDGALKPNIVAPGSAVSAVPYGLKESNRFITPGVAMKNGTSMASPMVAGASAMLLQLAHKYYPNKTVKSEDIKTVLESSAQKVPQEDAVSQGAGLVNITQAWQELNISLRNNLEITQNIQVAATNCSFFRDSELYQEQTGSGIMWYCDKDAPAQYSVEVKNLSQKNHDYNISWRFAHPALSLDKTTISANSNSSNKIEVKLDMSKFNAVETPLISAIIQLDRSDTAVIDKFIPVTIVMPKEINENKQLNISGSIDKMQIKRHYVKIDDNVSEVRTSLSASNSGAKIRHILYWPSGLPATSNENRTCYSGDLNCASANRNIQEVAPGVWEIIVQTNSESQATSYSLDINTVVVEPLAHGQAIILNDQNVLSFSGGFKNAGDSISARLFPQPITERKYERFKLSAGQSKTFSTTIGDNIWLMDALARSVDGGKISISGTNNGNRIGEQDGQAPGSLNSMVALGDKIEFTVTAVQAAPNSTYTEIWYEDGLWSRGNPFGKITVNEGQGFINYGRGQAIPANGSLSLNSGMKPSEGREFGSLLRLLNPEGVVYSQHSLRLVKPGIDLQFNTGLTELNNDISYQIYAGSLTPEEKSLRDYSRLIKVSDSGAAGANFTRVDSKSGNFANNSAIAEQNIQDSASNITLRSSAASSFWPLYSLSEHYILVQTGALKNYKVPDAQEFQIQNNQFYTAIQQELLPKTPVAPPQVVFPEDPDVPKKSANRNLANTLDANKLNSGANQESRLSTTGSDINYQFALLFAFVLIVLALVIRSARYKKF